MASKTASLGVALAALCLSATALWFGSGLNPIWSLTWIAAVPLLLAAQRLGPRLAFWSAVAAHLLGNLNTWRYASIVPLPIHLEILALPALAWGAGIWLFRRCAQRGKYLAAVFAFPVAWTAFESLWELASPHGTFFDLAYTQMNCAAIIQVAAVTGLLGIGFCVLLASSAVALLAGAGQFARKLPAALTAASLVGVALGYGFWRAHSAPASPAVTVGLVASDAPGNLWARSSEESLAVFRAYAEQLPVLAAKGASVVVLPEHLGTHLAESLGGNESKVDALFGDAARRHHLYLVVGVDCVDSRKSLWNQARVYAPDGRVAGVYSKHHLLPGPESAFTPGTARTTIPGPAGNWGLQICKDMDFPALSRQYGRAGVGLLLVPALDFRVDGWLHSRMAILRGVESGFSIARAANLGRLTLSDSRGQVLAELAADSAPFTTLVASLPVQHEVTLYDRFGDWFAWLDLAALIGLLWCATGRPGARAADQ